MTFRRSKYGNYRTECEILKRTFDSKGEMLRARELNEMQARGEISALQFQPVVTLTCGIKYKPDFCYAENDQIFYEDFKGHETDIFKLKAKLWGCHGPATLRLSRRKKNGNEIYKEIVPQ